MDIYSVPDSDLDDGNDNPKIIKRVFATVFGVVAFSLYIVLFKVIPQFEETFIAFDASLPWISALVTRIDHLFWLPAIASLLACAIWLVAASKPKIVSLFFIVSLSNLVAAFVCFMSSFVAMYLPIAQLGAAQ